MSNEIAAGVKQFFEAQEWTYDYYEEDGVFQTAVALGEGNGVMIHAIAGEAAITVMVTSDVAFAPEQSDAARAFVNAVNERLLLGALVLDSEMGVLYFRVGQNCLNQAPNAQIMEDIFMYPISFIDENYKTFADFAAGTISAEEALNQLFGE